MGKVIQKKQKLLLVADYFYPHWTGIAKSIYNLLRILRDEDDITVLTVQYLKTLKRSEEIFGARIIREPYIFTLSRAKYSTKIIFKFISLVKTSDVVFINSPCTNIIFFAIISKLLQKKLIIFHHGDLILPRGFLNKIIEIVFDCSTLIAFSVADKVSTHTRDYAEHSRVLKPFLYKTNPVILPIYLENINYKKKTKKIKEKNTVLFGFAGRFVEEKGFDILFDAIPLILQKIPNAHFIFAGEKNMPYENFFQKNKKRFEKVKKNITMLGLLKDKELVNFYKEIDFIIIPSRSDCFPFVQAEAMLSGTPAIASDIPGLRYLVKESGFGILFKTCDPNDLAKKTAEVYKNKSDIMKAHKKLVAILNNTLNVEKIKKFIIV